jgi:copper(I)-binding protein
MERKREFKVGVTFPLTLKFAKFGDVKVQLTVQDR